MYQGGTFPSYFISTAVMKKPDKTGRWVSIRKPRVAPKYGELETDSHSKCYLQHRNQRHYDKLALRAMVEMEKKRGVSLHMDGATVPPVPTHPTPVMMDREVNPITLLATTTASQYKRSFEQTYLPTRYTDSPQRTQRLMHHDLIARSSLSSYASRRNLPSPMRSLYSRHVSSRPLPTSPVSPRQLTYINIRL